MLTQSLFHIEWGIAIEKKGDSEPLFEQVHGDTILFLEAPQSSVPLLKADGAIASYPGAELHIYTADCFPVLFFTEDRNGPIAAVHAGWKGIKKGIIQKACRELKGPSPLHAILGPAIGSCCFAVRQDFIDDWDKAGLTPSRYLTTRNDRTYFNLQQYVTEVALSAISPANLHQDFFRCTACSAPPLPSFRRNKSANPRLRTWIRKSLPEFGI